MTEIRRRTREIEGLDPARIPFAELLQSQQPAILKGVASDWEITRKGGQSASSAIEVRKTVHDPAARRPSSPPPALITYTHQSRFVVGFGGRSKRPQRTMPAHAGDAYR